jgi:hypothetical protein
LATTKRTWIIVGACVLVVLMWLAGAGYLALNWMIDRSRYALHLPGTYYFVSFTGPWVPFQPVDEISRDEAMARGGYVVGIFNDQGQLTVIERYSEGALFFRYQYSYDADGKLSEERGWQGSNPVRTRRFDGSSI